MRECIRVILLYDFEGLSGERARGLASVRDAKTNKPGVAWSHRADDDGLHKNPTNTCKHFG